MLRLLTTSSVPSFKRSVSPLRQHALTCADVCWRMLQADCVSAVAGLHSSLHASLVSQRALALASARTTSLTTSFTTSFTSVAPSFFRRGACCVIRAGEAVRLLLSLFGEEAVLFHSHCLASALKKRCSFLSVLREGAAIGHATATRCRVRVMVRLESCAARRTRARTPASSSGVYCVSIRTFVPVKQVNRVPSVHISAKSASAEASSCPSEGHAPSVCVRVSGVCVGVSGVCDACGVSGKSAEASLESTHCGCLSEVHAPAVCVLGGG